MFSQVGKLAARLMTVDANPAALPLRANVRAKGRFGRYFSMAAVPHGGVSAAVILSLLFLTFDQMIFVSVSRRCSILACGSQPMTRMAVRLVVPNCGATGKAACVPSSGIGMLRARVYCRDHGQIVALLRLLLCSCDPISGLRIHTVGAVHFYTQCGAGNVAC